jgi:RNA polymerase sigma-70 factor (ECF subfamily)
MMIAPTSGMTSTRQHEETVSKHGANFTPTHWSVVLAAAGRRNSTSSRDALEKLCRNYWIPIYAFVRRQGHSPHDAQDFTQEFFARLLEKNYLADAPIVPKAVFAPSCSPP